MNGLRDGRQAARSFGWSGDFRLIAILCLVAMVAALVSQHVFGMQPCPWCVLQRLIVLVIGALALVGWCLRTWAGRAGVALAVLAVATSGVAAALWQHFKAAASASCNLTLADRIVSATRLDAALPDVFEARASCADAAVKLFGVPYDIWSLALFLAIAVIGLSVVVRPGPRTDPP